MGQLKTDKVSAKAAGDKHYFTGRPCLHGHVALRYVSNGNCYECNRVEHMRPESREGNKRSALRSMRAHPERVKANSQKWREKNPDKSKATTAAWREKNREHSRAAGRAAAKKARQERPEEKRASEAIRRARKYSATAGWADLNAIKAFYKACPSGHHVDHIIPLSHPLVCGLHVLENLQYLPASDNCSKKNHFVVAY